jgi:replicative DNA helicase
MGAVARHAAAARNRALQAVPDPDDPQSATSDAIDIAEPQTWKAQAVLNQWDPEHQLIGALMWLPAGQARPILDLVPDDAIGWPTIRWAYHLIRGLVDAGQDPNPVVVLATAKHQPCSQGIDPDSPPSPARHHKLAVYLAAAYTQTISAAAAPTYAREVLDAAYRRAFRANGIRMQQLSESRGNRADLTERFTLIQDELAELRRRCEIAAKPGWEKP